MFKLNSSQNEFYENEDYHISCIFNFTYLNREVFMKKIWLTSGVSVVLAGCLVFLLFFYKGQQPSPAPSPDGGTQGTSAGAEEIVNNSCISCHGENLQGGAGPAINKVGAKYDKSEIEDIINNGKNGMPAGVISNEEAAIVAEWLSKKK